MSHPALDRVLCRRQRLTHDLTTEHADSFPVGASPPEDVLLDLFEIEDVLQRRVRVRVDWPIWSRNSCARHSATVVLRPTS